MRTGLTKSPKSHLRLTRKGSTHCHCPWRLGVRNKRFKKGCTLDLSSQRCTKACTNHPLSLDVKARYCQLTPRSRHTCTCMSTTSAQLIISIDTRQCGHHENSQVGITMVNFNADRDKMEPLTIRKKKKNDDFERHQFINYTYLSTPTYLKNVQLQCVWENTMPKCSLLYLRILLDFENFFLVSKEVEELFTSFSFLPRESLGQNLRWFLSWHWKAFCWSVMSVLNRADDAIDRQTGFKYQQIETPLLCGLLLLLRAPFLDWFFR